MNDKPVKTPSEALTTAPPSQAKTPETAVLSQYVQAATAENTRKAYRSAIRQFEKWGGRLPTDRDTIIRYLLAKAEQLNPRTLDLQLTAISQWHQYQGLYNPARDPLVGKTIDGIRRAHGRPKRKAKALRLEHIAQMIKKLEERPDSKKRRRDIALIMTGFFGAFRRSELVSIDASNLTWEPEGLLIHLPRSKTDQHSSGTARALPYAEDSDYCPATAIRHWMAHANIHAGPLFRPVNRWDQVQDKALNPAAINDLLKTLGNACQFEFAPELSSHSFRRGMSTSAARERIDFELIKKQGGWKSDATVWQYIEEGQRFSDNAATILMKKLNTLMGTQ